MTVQVGEKEKSCCCVVNKLIGVAMKHTRVSEKKINLDLKDAEIKQITELNPTLTAKVFPHFLNLFTFAG